MSTITHARQLSFLLIRQGLDYCLEGEHTLGFRLTFPPTSFQVGGVGGSCFGESEVGESGVDC